MEDTIAQANGTYELVRLCCRQDGCNCGLTSNGGVFLRPRTWRKHNPYASKEDFDSAITCYRLNGDYCQQRVFLQIKWCELNELLPQIAWTTFWTMIQTMSQQPLKITMMWYSFQTMMIISQMMCPMRVSMKKIKARKM